MLKPDRTVIDYLYDFGDSWEHRITVTKVRQGDLDIAYPRYLGGCGAGPPEDCGGVPGFYDLLGARADPDHPEHAQAVEWLDDYDPDEVEVLPIKYALSRIAATQPRPGWARKPDRPPPSNYSGQAVLTGWVLFSVSSRRAIISSVIFGSVRGCVSQPDPNEDRRWPPLRRSLATASRDTTSWPWLPAATTPPDLGPNDGRFRRLVDENDARAPKCCLHLLNVSESVTRQC